MHLRVHLLYAENSYGDVMTRSEIEALCRGLLHNAAARQWAASRVEPETPSADYLTGFAAGWEGGEVAALALIISLITEQSATRLVEEARAQAAVDTAFPFELHIDDHHVVPTNEEAA